MGHKIYLTASVRVDHCAFSWSKEVLYLKQNEKHIYNILRTDCVYSGIFIHNPIIALDAIFNIYYTLCPCVKTVVWKL